MRLTHFILIGAITAILTGCGNSGNNRRHSIAVSIPPQATLLKEITGDSIDVVTLLHSDANPEAFEPSVADIKGLFDAETYIAIGDLPFEHTLADRLAPAGIKVIDSSAGIEPLFGTHHNHRHDNGNYSDADPHTWTSVRNMRKMAQTMLETVISTDPVNKNYYIENYSRLNTRLDSLDKAMSIKLMPMSGRRFLVWHPSLSYFARDYDLIQIAIGSENKETSAAKMKENLDIAKDSGIAVFFIQANFDSRQAENLSHQINVTPITFNPLDPKWEEQLSNVADAIVSAYSDKAQ